MNKKYFIKYKLDIFSEEAIRTFAPKNDFDKSLQFMEGWIEIKWDLFSFGGIIENPKALGLDNLRYYAEHLLVFDKTLHEDGKGYFRFLDEPLVIEAEKTGNKISLKIGTPDETNTQKGEKYKEKVKDVKYIITVPSKILDKTIKKFCLSMEKKVHKLNKKINWKLI